MGVLDTLEDVDTHSFGLGQLSGSHGNLYQAAAEEETANGASNSGECGEQRHNEAVEQLLSSSGQQQQGEATDAANIANNETSQKPSSSSSQQSSNKAAAKEANNKQELKLTRMERKRTREKQRRLDTNSQFNALESIVREIDTVDFVDESQYNLILYGDNNNNGGVGVGVNNNGGDMINNTTLLGDIDNHQKLGIDASSSSKKLKSSEDDNTNNLNNNPLIHKKQSSSSSTTPANNNNTNRVDLLTHTISHLSKFRIIRNTRNTELRNEKRKNCELRKENEELRRMVVHYKTVGMGKKMQEKVRECECEMAYLFCVV